MRQILLLFSFLLLFLPFCKAQEVPGIAVDLEIYSTGLSSPVDIANAGDERLFVVEKEGIIRIIDPGGEARASPFLDISSSVESGGGEQGLLGLAFHPDYTENGFFFINYIDINGNTNVLRFSRDPDDPEKADPDSELPIIEIEQPFGNHNGGDLAFGPDGYLYIPLGDGGSANDPEGNGQDPLTLLGSMLRLDIDSAEPYAIPPGNPFVNEDFILHETWALGLRNPWRFSFDRLTGDIWIGDVGQNTYEEINFQAAGSPGGENYGWNCYEGSFPTGFDNCEALGGSFIDPLSVYTHDGGACSVTGGYVYRGQEFPQLEGVYFYTDYCDGIIRALIPSDSGEFTEVELMNGPDTDLVSFGEDASGELYLAGLTSGNIFRLVDACTGLDAPEISLNEATLSVPDTYATYQWYLDGEAIEGATESTLAEPEEGSVVASVSTDLGCALETEAFVITDVEELLGISSWSVSPNPFGRAIQLSVRLVEALEMTVELREFSGKVIRRQRLPESTLIQESLDLGQLPKGVYLLSLHAKGLHATKKLVKR